MGNKALRCAMLLILVVIPIYSLESTTSQTIFSTDENQSITDSHSVSEIRLTYYLRKFYAQNFYNNLTLSILIEGTNNIDCVLTMITPEGEDSYNMTMVETETTNLYITSFQFEYPENVTYIPYDSPIIVRYNVQYYVNTTTGIMKVSDICPYQTAFGQHTDGLSIVFYDTPDLWYEEGSTGHEVTWAVSTGYPDFYKLYEDDFLIEAWSWDGPLTINADDLEIGDHVFKVEATQGWAFGSETVTVHVVTTIPYGVSTGSVGPITDPLATGFPLIAIGTAISTVLIVGIAIIYRRKTH